MNIFWFRRDLRLDDNIGLHHALQKGKTQPIFIFDRNILDKIEKFDARLTFIHQTLKNINKQLEDYGSSINFYYGYPHEIWKKILSSHNIENVFWNKDYEPYAIKRDYKITSSSHKGSFFTADARFVSREDAHERQLPEVC